MTAGARQTLGAVRSAGRPEPRYDRPPPVGDDRRPKRVVVKTARPGNAFPARHDAFERLIRVLADDVERTIRGAILAGWHPLDHAEVAESCRTTLYRLLVDEVVDDALSAWREAQ